MHTKDKNNKTTCTKNVSAEIIIPVPAKVVADIVKGSESMVKQVRQGVKKGKGKLCKKIQLVDDLLATGIAATIEQVQQISEGIE